MWHSVGRCTTNTPLVGFLSSGVGPRSPRSRISGQIATDITLQISFPISLSSDIAVSLQRKGNMSLQLQVAGQSLAHSLYPPLALPERPCCHTVGTGTTFSATSTSASNFATTLLAPQHPLSSAVQSIQFQVHKYMGLSGIPIRCSKILFCFVLVINADYF